MRHAITKPATAMPEHWLHSLQSLLQKHSFRCQQKTVQADNHHRNKQESVTRQNLSTTLKTEAVQPIGLIVNKILMKAEQQNEETKPLEQTNDESNKQ